MLDTLRKHYPKLGFSLFAMEPGEPVTLEIYTADGQVYAFTGNTVEAAIHKAFPPASLVVAPIAPGAEVTLSNDIVYLAKDGLRVLTPQTINVFD